jgi:hypothetical protein
MLFSFSRLKHVFSTTTSYINNHRRPLFILFFLLPFLSYLLTWTLATTRTFLPNPLRQAHEVLIVVAHPDDECITPSKFSDT